MRKAGQYMQWKLEKISQCSWKWGHQSRKPDNILSNDMTIGRPAIMTLLTRLLERVASCGEVVNQGVEPDIDCLAVIIWHSDAPA